MPFNFQSTLYGMEFLGLDGVHVALHRHAVPEQRLQFVKVRLQQRLKVLIQQNLLVQQQDAEVQIIHALTDGVHIHIGLRRLHLALKRCNLLLVRDESAVVHRLVHVDANAVLVFLQSLHVVAVHREHVLQGIGQCHHVALVRCLCGSGNLRQPSLHDVRHREVGGLLYQVIPLDERVVLTGQLLTFVERDRHLRGNAAK